MADWLCVLQIENSWVQKWKFRANFCITVLINLMIHKKKIFFSITYI